jgi:hypothetical protein
MSAVGHRGDHADCEGFSANSSESVLPITRIERVMKYGRLYSIESSALITHEWTVASPARFETFSPLNRSWKWGKPL